MTSPGQPLSDADREQLIAEARARALAAQGPGARIMTPQEAAEAAPAPAAEDPGLGVGVEQIRAQQAAQGSAGPVAGAPLPAEEAQNAAMEQMRAQFEALVGQLAAQGQTIQALQRQLANVQSGVVQGAGDPFLVRYADAARDKLLTHAITNPDLGGVHLAPVYDQARSETVLRHRASGHFESVLADAEQLAATARDVIEGKASPQEVLDQAGRVITFIERVHPRKTGKYLDYSAVSDDLTAVLEEAGKLLQAA
jgi:hypothetical protein